MAIVHWFLNSSISITCNLKFFELLSRVAKTIDEDMIAVFIGMLENFFDNQQNSWKNYS
jgi:hypothetical protein